MLRIFNNFYKSFQIYSGSNVYLENVLALAFEKYKRAAIREYENKVDKKSVHSSKSRSNHRFECSRKWYFYFYATVHLQIRVQLDNIRGNLATGRLIRSCNRERFCFLPDRGPEWVKRARTRPLLRNFPRCRANGHVNKVLGGRARVEHEA